MKYVMTAIALLIGAGLGGCGNGKIEPGGSGFIEANDVVVSAETSGRVLNRHFDEGTVVKAGDTLAIIDPSRLQLELASAEAGRRASLAGLETARLQVIRTQEAERFARTERDRVDRLLSSGSATQKQLDQLAYELTQAVNARKSADANVHVVETQIEKIDADINRIKRQLTDCFLLSPAAGTAVEKYIEPGELVAPGKAIAKIARLDTVWVKVYLPSTEFSLVKPTDRAKVSTEGGGTTYDGEVIWTSSEAEFTPKNVQTDKSRANLVYAVKVRVANSDGRLKIGMPVYVTLVK